MLLSYFSLFINTIDEFFVTSHLPNLTFILQTFECPEPNSIAEDLCALEVQVY